MVHSKKHVKFIRLLVQRSRNRSRQREVNSQTFFKNELKLNLQHKNNNYTKFYTVSLLYIDGVGHHKVDPPDFGLSVLVFYIK